MNKPSIKGTGAALFFPSAATTNELRNQRRERTKQGTEGTRAQQEQREQGHNRNRGNKGTTGTEGTTQVRWRIPTRLAKEINIKAIKQGKKISTLVTEILSEVL